MSHKFPTLDRWRLADRPLAPHEPEGDGGGQGLFHGDIKALSSSKLLDWPGVVVEENVLKASAMGEEVSVRFRLALWRTCGTGEHAPRRGNFLPFIKPPGSLTFVPPGVIPAARTEGTNELICCSLDAGYMASISEDVERSLRRDLVAKTGFRDPSLARLLELLATEAKTGGESGRLYSDSLSHALGMRIVMLARALPPFAAGRQYSLSSVSLQHVLELIHSSNGNVGLGELASESGYSRRHFLRMFQQTLGMSPYRYVLEVKLQRAEALMKEKSRSLIDIALSCGFSSHSHMSRVFRDLRGATPSEFRRKM